MIDPVKCAERLIETDSSETAEALLDLMIWANRRDLGSEGDYDEILNILYIKLDRAQEARDEYVKSRATHASAASAPSAS
jgi:hypothetical protein